MTEEGTAEELIRLYNALPPEKKERFWEGEAVRFMKRNTELQSERDEARSALERLRQEILDAAASRFKIGAIAACLTIERIAGDG